MSNTNIIKVRENTIREYRSNFRAFIECLFPFLQITPYYLIDRALIENNGTISKYWKMIVHFTTLHDHLF